LKCAEYCESPEGRTSWSLNDSYGSDFKDEEDECIVNSSRGLSNLISYRLAHSIIYKFSNLSHIRNEVVFDDRITRFIDLFE
jgi:hypothetical protein